MENGSSGEDDTLEKKGYVTCERCTSVNCKKICFQSLDDQTFRNRIWCDLLGISLPYKGNKMNNVEVVYTPWSNLKKFPSMDVGQVGFHNPRMVRMLTVEKRVNDIINRLNKTRVERRPDLKAEKEASNAAAKAERKIQLKEKKRREELERLEKERRAEIRSYKGLMVAEKMTSNRQIASAGKSMQEMEDEFV